MRSQSGSPCGDRRWRRRARALLVSVGVSVAATAQAAPLHPLDPLTADELLVVRDVLAGSRQFSPRTSFAWIQLDEPPKRLVPGFEAAADFPRRAAVAAIDYGNRRSFGVIVDIGAARIASLTELDGVQPGIVDQDGEIARAVIDADPRIKRALIKRGLTIPGRVSDAVQVVADSVGHDPAMADAKSRIVRVLFASDQAAVSSYSPPLDGIMVLVDVFARRVTKLYDAAGVASAKIPHDVFDPAVRGTAMPLNPVLPTQPGGRNFAIDGNVVTWRNWQFRLGFNLREGLVLYQLGFADQGRRRSILYRASLAEVASAYGDPSDLWSWVEYLDEGIFGLGALSIPVRPGREVPESAVTLSPVLPDATAPGFSRTAADRIYVYERDGGAVMYFRDGDRVVQARATELVVGFFVGLGNYDYGFNWVFKADGSFGFEVELAGLILTKLVPARACEQCRAVAQGPGADGTSRTYEATGDDRYGSLVYPNVVGVNHQHWFGLRLDFDIDGTDNAVLESNVKRAGRGGAADDAGADERYFTATRTVFGRAADAARDADHDTARSWTIYNPGVTNRLGQPVGYALMPGSNAMTILPRSRARGPMAFTFHHFWVTPYRDGELFADGAYPNQARNDYADTLYAYAGDAPIYDRDVVVWYSLGETHVPRPEDFPLMSSMKLSVGFQPAGFFDRNPALGLARE